MSAKFGYEAIKYILTKALTKKGSQGIARIPGKAYDMRMKQLVDEMALKMKALGYDINNVTQKEVQGLLDSAEALQKQKTKAFTSQLMKDMDVPKKGTTITDERGRVWDFGTKDRPFPGWKPEVIQSKRGEFLKKYTKDGKPNDVELNALVNEHRILSKESKKLGEAGEKYGKFKDLNTRIDEIEEVLDFMKKEFPEDLASGGIAGQLHLNEGGRTGYFAGLIAKGAKAGMGKFTKAEVLIEMLKNTLKGSKDAYVKKTFPNFIKELTKNPELANDPNVWKQLTTGLPKKQRLVVHSDDTVDFFRQTEFGPHNIENITAFQKKHPYLTQEQATTITKMEPEDQVLEMKRLETIRNRTKQAAGGIAGQLHLNEGGRTGFKKGSMRKRLQKDYKSYARLSDFLKTAPPNFWLFPEKYGMTRDDAMTYLKERFMYGDLDADRKDNASGGRVSYTKGGLAHVLGV